MTDHEIVLQIQEWLSGREWTCDDLPDIANLLNNNGYKIESPAPTFALTAERIER